MTLPSPTYTTSHQSNTTTTQINSAILMQQKNSNVSTVIRQDIHLTPLQLQWRNVSATNVIFTDSYSERNFPLNRIA
ncbi:hypothetical protein CW304_15840 [Bacillus sp. UFRGS-B20]|nr:hypothetical protein CW304_15840 [Bacillus sp. UFRGS-B20]